MVAPWHYLSGRVRNGPPAFEAAHGENVWKYASKHPELSELISGAMACDARVSVPAIVNGCAGFFDGINIIVDVGGAKGTALGVLVKAFPWIKDKGMVIIVEAVIREDEDSKFKYVGLMLDMIMLAHTNNGKERTEEEWGSILTKAGFSRFTVKPIHAVQSVIIAYPC
ncbi:Acetylserotonin o-methyltransferase [Thalictrum thalictroides]|uniref:Acetylserotonin o-methyltransferase n=1 Tax=Thalictrum thalictroides TaxID=46969 RepID=A0A7J6VUQ7_THATH|nr:Acetylserotonin o-methyltransferase [Thalictrum thalictroides]